MAIAPEKQEQRMKRGLEIIESGKQIIENEDGSFSVPSQTSNSVYEVRLIGQQYVCTCPDFEYREVEACKHIFAVRLFIAANTYIKNEPKPKVFAEDAIPCDKCGSIRVIKFGIANKKQIYYCKDCKHKFRQASMLKKAKFNPELVSLTLDLYFSGLSLRKIARSVSDHFNVDIGYATIYTWIQKYIPLISQYVNSLVPKELSDTWHADELFVKMKGGIHAKNGKSVAFVWNIMDRDTRFLIASKLTEDRGEESAIAAFREAIRNAHAYRAEAKPKEIYTDGHKAYDSAISTLFRKKSIRPEHMANCGVAKPHANNNRIERLNGTLRERTKVQRGWKSKQTPLAEGARIQYNFVKPHMALEGKTPASAAGMEVKGWNELLAKAINHNNRDSTTEIQQPRFNNRDSTTENNNR
jgi:putative transposase